MDKSCILLYHGVTNSKSFGIENYSNKHIQSDEFEKQMKFLKENKKVVSIRDIKKEPNSVAITFDDTFKNVRDVALPILKKYNIPATFFISTGFIENNKNFWVDRIEHMINFSDRKEITFDGKLFNLSDKSQKINSLINIKSKLKKCEPLIREKYLNDIRVEIGWKDDVEVNNYKNLNVDDVRKLHNPPMYEVGGHTVNHEILSYLDDETLDSEISDCIKTLEEITNKTIDLFSYPEGQQNHYDERVIRCLKKNGITISPSAIDGFIGDEDEFNYRRVMVGFLNTKFPFKEYYND